MKHIDIHCHLNLEQFDQDLNETISRAKAQDIGMIVIGSDYKTSERAVKIAEENSDIWACVGLHPDDIPNEVLNNDAKTFNYDAYKKLAEHPKVVAIGECGLDYFRSGNLSPEEFAKNKLLQREIFEMQIAIANEVEKPLMLHLRNGIGLNKIVDNSKNAYADALEVLKKHAKVSGDVHFFVGNSEEGRQFIDLGFRLSFTGVITFARNYDEVIKNIPLNMIMAETDAPFVAPIPYRGQRNEPVFVIEVIKKIAKIKGEPLEKVQAHLLDNARKLFSI